MTTSERIWLEVSYDEQNAAKAAGARWDRTLRSWYAPRPGMTELQPWVGRAPLPDVLDGEDRNFGDGLFVDLIPDSCWFTNVRSCVSQRDWDRLRRMVYRRARDRCEICGAGRDPDVDKWLEAHERWEYNETTQTQRLKRIICLCSFCHEVTHFGLAIVRGHEERALRHLLYVTNWSGRRARRHIDDAFRLWEERSRRDWALELGVLLQAGIAVHEPPDPYERRRIGRW
ncbi:DUF5710 domain-containing protein [Mycolicibacterium moriokaense]|uniref:DUF5710 domain-containing protein n=1 Tax=Mycolicibacterium moriokaense TaxID=39691 RepID=A0A318HDD9_9MYCO|nr:DUF5710 domain-containing protein [Mycolicibacterium moriokaense]PXX06370.1 hypothetical protein C8E89_114143 [Mycolicibacterium moriokaense]